MSKIKLLKQVKNTKIYTLTTLSFALLFVSNPSFSLDLVSDFQKASSYDPTFQGAIAEKRGNQAAANQAWTVYTPSASFSTQRSTVVETGPTTNITVTQPIFDYASLASVWEAEPKRGFAEATYIAKEQDLASRLLKAADAIILANENLRLNNSKINALNLEYSAAKRKFELGQGTITDQRDIEVKLAQAKSLQINYKTQLIVATKQYASITGETPNVAEFVLPPSHRPFELKSTDDYIDLTLQNSPNILIARYSEKISELEVKKSYGSFMPVVSAQFSDVKSSGTDAKSVYALVSVPLQAGTFYALQGVKANFDKSRAATRDAEEKAKVEVGRLRSLLDTGFDSLDIQKDAIKAAELSVEANIKSYEGGVRTTVDVLNATQTVFQVKSDYVTAVTVQAENYLALLLNSSLDTGEALKATYKYLFAK